MHAYETRYLKMPANVTEDFIIENFHAAQHYILQYMVASTGTCMSAIHVLQLKCGWMSDFALRVTRGIKFSEALLPGGPPYHDTHVPVDLSDLTSRHM